MSGGGADEVRAHEPTWASPAKRVRRVAAVSATIRTCCPSAAAPRLTRGAPRTMARRARRASPTGARYVLPTIPPRADAQRRSVSWASAMPSASSCSGAGPKRPHPRSQWSRSPNRGAAGRRPSPPSDQDRRGRGRGGGRRDRRRDGRTPPARGGRGRRSPPRLVRPELGEARRGEVRLLGDQLEAPKVGRVDAQGGRHGLVRGDRARDEAAYGVGGVDIVIGYRSSC